VKEKALLRDLIHAAQNIQQHAFDAEEQPDSLAARAVEVFSTVAARGARISWRNKFHTPDELAEGQPDFLIDGILPMGVTFIGALSGAGKTFFALSMCRALTTGQKFLGNFSVPERTDCLYLVPEMSAQAFKKRLRRFGINDRFRCQTISDGEPLNLDDPLLAHAIRELKPVVFLDTAIRFAGVADENSSAENAMGLGRAIFRLLHLGARAVVCLHHRAKDAARVEDMTLENVLRGTGDLGAIADAVWGLQSDRGPGGAKYLCESKESVRLHVRCVKLRDGKPVPDFRVQLEPFLDQTGDFGILTDQPDDARQKKAERLIAEITANPTITKIDLARRTGIGRNGIEKLAGEVGFLYQKGSDWKWKVP
jgi:hypothetical protein